MAAAVGSFSIHDLILSPTSPGHAGAPRSPAFLSVDWFVHLVFFTLHHLSQTLPDLKHEQLTFFVVKLGTGLEG